MTAVRNFVVFGTLLKLSSRQVPIPHRFLSASHQISSAGQPANKAREPRRDFHFNLLPKMPTDF